MSKISKKTKMVAAVAFVLGATAIGGGIASADSTSTVSTTGHMRQNPMADVVTAIAQKFNLNSTDVQAVVDQVMTSERAKVETERATQAAKRLADAVTAGKLTQAQADLITAKQSEEKTFMESLKNMSQTDREAALKTHMTALKQWLTDNKIPAGFGIGFGGRGHGGPDGARGGKGFGFGLKDRANTNGTTPTTSTNTQ